MITTSIRTTVVGRLAIAIGVVTILMLVFIALFFTVGQPWGSLNDASIALEAILSAVLAWVFYPWLHARSPRGSAFGLLAAGLGALIVAIGSALVISGAADYVAASQYMNFGFSWVGLWLLTLNYLARQRTMWPPRLIQLGRVVGAVMAFGLMSGFGILYGIDAQDTQPWFVIVGGLSSLGWAILYPIWAIWSGRALLSAKTFISQQEISA